MIVKRPCIYPPKNADRPLHIWLPDDWQTSGRRYPVMYFFDGHNLFSDQDATYGKSWGMKAFLEGWEKEMIVVGIECGHDGYERLSEYLPYPADPDSRFAQFAPMGRETMEWILNDIKPVIDTDYPTIPFRECTAIGGSSMGGLMSIYAAVHYNRWFSKAACVSSAIGFCMGPLMADLEANPLNPDTRMYFSWGTYEAYGLEDRDHVDTASHTYRWSKQAADRVSAQGAATQMFCQIGGYHCEASWEEQVPEFMDFLWMQ